MLLAALAGNWLYPAHAQQSGRIARIGLLWIASRENSNYAQSLREGLRSYGHVPGKDILLDESFLAGHYDGLSDAATRMVASKVDLIVCFGATATQAALRATHTIPVVFITGADPTRAGIVANLARPEGNATGVTAIADELIGKRIELFKSAIPSIRHVGLLYYPGSPTEVRQLQAYETAGRALDIEIRPVAVRDSGDIDPVIGSLPAANVDSLLVVGSTMLLAHGREVVAAVGKRRIPAMYSQPAFVDQGGLISYGSDASHLFGQASGYVDKILRGAKPGELAVQQQSRFELVVNLAAAKALGLTFPKELVARADRIVE